MLGAIVGDIAGSRFEWHNIKSKDFEFLTRAGRCRPTDDSVMTLAVARAILDVDGDAGALPDAAVGRMREMGRLYPRAGYGGAFSRWLTASAPHPYHSWGNGAAMRVSPCGFAAKTVEDAVKLAVAATAVTHDHPEGIKAAEAVASAIFLAKSGESMAAIRDHIESKYYRIDFKLDDIREEYEFDVSCQGSVPQALEAFFESTGFEDAVRNAVSIGGDSDTIAAVTGGIAEAYYGIPAEIRETALTFLDETQLAILNDFESKYGTFPAKI